MYPLGKIKGGYAGYVHAYSTFTKHTETPVCEAGKTETLSLKKTLQVICS